MAGHSKWAQIKRKKAVTDARRGQLWTRLLKEISVAAREGGGDPDGNARLRSAIQDAKASNVPADNIERAIQRGTGELEGVSYDEVTYEGYSPGGGAILIEALTDNRNRTVAELRHLFSRHAGNLGETGSVAWMFTKRGYLALGKADLSEEAFMELAVELGVEDIAITEDGYEIYTSPEAYAATRAAIEARGLELLGHELAMVPQTYLELAEEHAGPTLRLLEALEDHDDVQNVWSNLDVDSELLAAIG